MDLTEGWTNWYWNHVLLFNKVVASDPALDQPGGVALGIGETGAYLSSVAGIQTIGAGAGNILKIGNELIGVGETVHSSLNLLDSPQEVLMEL